MNPTILYKKIIIFFLFGQIIISANILPIINKHYNLINKDILKEQKKALKMLNIPFKDIKNNKIIKKYGFSNKNFTKKEILLRIEPIPKEIMLAQAYLESDNGKSRFAKKIYNFFGIWTYTKKGIIPLKRKKNKSYRMETFKNPKEAINRYCEILNSAIFYKKFRKLRLNYLLKNNFNIQAINQKNIIKMIYSLKKYAEDENYIYKLEDIVLNKKYYD